MQRGPAHAPTTRASAPGPVAWLALGALLACAPAPAAAASAGEPTLESETGPAAAKREFARGQRAFARGDYPGAGAAFEAAYHHAPHPAPLWNAARAWHRAGEPARAANLYARYLAEAPPEAPDRGEATRALADLAPRLGRLRIVVPGGASPRVDGVPDDRRGAFDVYVVPGGHVVEMDGAHGPVRRACDVQAGETVSLALADDAPPSLTPSGATPAREPRREGISPWWLVAGAGLTAASGAVTVASGLATLDARGAFDREPSPELLADGQRLQAQTNVALAITGGLALATGALAVFFVDFGGPSARAKMAATPHGLVVTGAF